MSSTSQYLLDTGVFYYVNHEQVDRLLEKYTKEALRASVIVPFEILSGLPDINDPNSEDTYTRRRSAMIKYHRLAGMAKTFWSLPTEIKTRAFGVTTPNAAAPSFSVLIQTCLDCNTFSEFDKVVKQARSLSGEMPTIEWLRDQADTAARSFVNGIDASICGMKAIVEKELQATGHDDDLLRRKLRRGYIPYIHHVGDLNKYTFMILAQVAGKWDGSLPHSDLYQFMCATVNKLRNDYDGSIDFYVNVFSLYWTTKWLDSGGAKMNDYFDLDHLVYLDIEGANRILVTTDKPLNDRCNSVCPNRSILASDFVA